MKLVACNGCGAIPEQAEIRCVQFSVATMPGADQKAGVNRTDAATYGEFCPACVQLVALYVGESPSESPLPTESAPRPRKK